MTLQILHRGRSDNTCCWMWFFVLAMNLVSRTCQKPAWFLWFSQHSFHIPCRESIDVVVQISISRLLHQFLAVCCLWCCEYWHFWLNIVWKGCSQNCKYYTTMMMSGMLEYFQNQQQVQQVFTVFMRGNWFCWPSWGKRTHRPNPSTTENCNIPSRCAAIFIIIFDCEV